MPDAPAADEIEVSVFGPGIGESITVHLGGGHWIVVDSCRDRASGRAAALVYLESLGLDPAICVRAVVASHWDSDHIRALGEIVDTCPAASFWSSGAIGCDEFDALLRLADRDDEPLGNRLRELAGILSALRKREEEEGQRGLHGPRFAAEATMLFELPAEGGLPRRAVHALSPSDRSKIMATEEVRRTLGGGPEIRRRVQKMSRNDASVVLLLDIGGEGVLLGGDLECSDDLERGWNSAVRRAAELGISSDLVKIPHHGSINADDDGMWEGALLPEPAAALTPFFGGTSLPSDEDRQRIRGRTPRCFLTAQKATPATAVVLHSVVPPNGSVSSVEGEMGHVRWRRTLTSGSGQWSVALSNGAEEV